MNKILMIAMPLAITWLSACAVLTSSGRDLIAADNLAEQRKYTEAVTTYRKIIRNHPDSRWAADARFRLASTLTYHDNRHRNYTQALRQFELFLKSHPDHSKAKEARDWRQVLKTIEQLKRLDIRHEKRRRKRR